MASQLHAPVQGGLITWKSGQIRTNLCEGGVTRVTNPADAALAGAIYACGGIIVLRGHNYICTHICIEHYTPHTATSLVNTYEVMRRALDCLLFVCSALINNNCWCLILCVFWGLFFNCVNFPDRSPGAEKSRPLRMFYLSDCIVSTSHNSLTSDAS